MTLPLTNQQFETSLTGWAASENPSTFEWQNGAAHVIAGVTAGGIGQSIGAVQAGTLVTVKYRVLDVAVQDVKSRLSGGEGVQVGTEHIEPGTYTDIFLVDAPANKAVQIYTDPGGEILIDFVIARTNMAGFFTTQMQDRDDDLRQFTLPTTQVSAANHDAQYVLAGALVTAIEGISRLTTRQWDFGARRTETGDPKPTAGSAQVNIEWQVTYVEDTTLEVRTVRIGGANLDISGILLAGSNVADLSATEMAAFVTAFEAYVVGPNGNAVTVSQVAFLE